MGESTHLFVPTVFSRIPLTSFPFRPTGGTFLAITLAFWLSVFTYYPRHLAYLSRRFSYYVFEDETVDLNLLIRDWIVTQFRRGWEGVKAVGGGSGDGIVREL